MMKKRAMLGHLSGYAFISPFILGFMLFTVIPIGASFYLAFTDYNMVGSPTWIGHGRPIFGPAWSNCSHTRR